jgi:hypothetical protein
MDGMFGDWRVNMDNSYTRFLKTITEELGIPKDWRLVTFQCSRRSGFWAEQVHKATGRGVGKNIGADNMKILATTLEYYREKEGAYSHENET